MLSGNAAEIQRLRSKPTTFSAPTAAESKKELKEEAARSCDASSSPSQPSSPSSSSPPPSSSSQFSSAACLAKAQLLGNRAQAKAQLRDPSGASDDCSKQLKLLLLAATTATLPASSLLSSSASDYADNSAPDNDNAIAAAVAPLVLKALVRRALANEELGKLK